MGEIAEMMLGGVLCGHCGEALNCTLNENDESCEEGGIPMFCSKECAEEAGSTGDQICNH